MGMVVNGGKGLEFEVAASERGKRRVMLDELGMEMDCQKDNHGQHLMTTLPVFWTNWSLNPILLILTLPWNAQDSETTIEIGPL